MLSLQQIAACLPNGRVVAGGVSFAAIGHSGKDTSGRVLLSPNRRHGITVESLAGDDPLQLRDFVEERCGLPRWEPSAGRREEPARIDPQEAARQERAREQHRLAREAEARIKAERVIRIWQEADADPRGKLPDRYLRDHRGLTAPASACGHALRYHPAGPWEGERVPMMLGVMRCIVTNKPVGLHRTRLDPVTAAKLGRKMLGRAKAAAIKLTPDEDVTTGLHIAEGVETAIAGLTLGLAPMWAMGSVGGIAAFPVLPGIEVLTVCAETGEASEAAVQEVGTRWAEAGREVRICRPRRGSDLNDAIREAAR